LHKFLTIFSSQAIVYMSSNVFIQDLLGKRRDVKTQIG